VHIRVSHNVNPFHVLSIPRRSLLPILCIIRQALDPSLASCTMPSTRAHHISNRRSSRSSLRPSRIEEEISLLWLAAPEPLHDETRQAAVRIYCKCVCEARIRRIARGEPHPYRTAPFSFVLVSSPVSFSLSHALVNKVPSLFDPRACSSKRDGSENPHCPQTEQSKSTHMHVCAAHAASKQVSKPRPRFAEQ
jgi:hypothetical protein